ncbi:MAG: hypothetical protein UZ22_OP11002000541 [Microgenomates bacterium OLB23]|nr:MAG: hypothetical protein UZ22_OP11002000541 [Microgenomates bacterium OLB23]
MKLLAALFVVCFISLSPASAFADYTYTSPTNFTQVPKEPEVRALQGAVIRKDSFTLVVAENTSPWDAYVSYGYVKKSQPLRLCRYWQISDIYEFKLRSHFNNAVIAPQRVHF